MSKLKMRKRPWPKRKRKNKQGLDRGMVWWIIFIGGQDDDQPSKEHVQRLHLLRPGVCCSGQRRWLPTLCCTCRTAGTPPRPATRHIFMVEHVNKTPPRHLFTFIYMSSTMNMTHFTVTHSLFPPEFIASYCSNQTAWEVHLDHQCVFGSVKERDRVV